MASTTTLKYGPKISLSHVTMKGGGSELLHSKRLWKRAFFLLQPSLRYDRYKTQIHSQKYTATAFSDSPILCRVANWPALYRAQAALWHAADSIGVYNKFSIMQQCNRCCNSPIKPTAPWFDCFSPFPIVFDNQRWTKLQALRCRKGANNVTCFWRTDAIGCTNSK